MTSSQSIYLVFAIQAYDDKLEDGRLNEVVYIELICQSEECALARAKQIIPNKKYRVSGVYEKHNT